MNIRVFEKDGIRGYHLGDIEAYLKEERPAFQLDEYILLGCPHKLDYNDTMMHEDSVIKLMGWTHKEHGILMSLAIKEWIRSFKRGKRAYSTTHRIEIAYKSKYRCNMCDMILPPTFECDHIVELQDGGMDTYENLQAVCNNCHAKKTRANVLRRDKAFKETFGRRYEAIQKNAFDKFRYNKSKYF